MLLLPVADETMGRAEPAVAEVAPVALARRVIQVDVGLEVESAHELLFAQAAGEKCATHR
jgi:hypothetical protein